MKFRQFPCFLRSADPYSNGSGSTHDPAPLAALPDPPAAAAETETKPGLLENIRASLASKTTLLADVAAATSRADTAETALAAANTELTALRLQVKTLSDERAGIVKALDDAKAANTSTEEAAAGLVASMGFDAAALPASEPAGNSLEALEMKLGAETDPKEIVRLNQQLEARKAALKN